MTTTTRKPLTQDQRDAENTGAVVHHLHRQFRAGKFFIEVVAFAKSLDMPRDRVATIFAKLYRERRWRDIGSHVELDGVRYAK